MRRRNIVTSMKDFYWDIRPKPEFGTVELRVCDTPLRVIDAVDIAALAQALAAELLCAPRRWGDEHFEWIYSRNRFQASRYGLNGEFIAMGSPDAVTLRESLITLLAELRSRFIALGAADAYHRLQDRVGGTAVGATWLRRRYDDSRDFRSVVSDMSQTLLAAA
jgi:glutamate---cysteine ligase / carboxylate-amine ligase